MVGGSGADDDAEGVGAFFSRSLEPGVGGGSFGLAEELWDCLPGARRARAAAEAAAAASEAVAGAGATTVPAPPSDAASPAPSGALVDPKLLQLMQGVASGQVSPEDAARRMRELSAGYQQVGDFAAVDAWRAQRTGFPEVVWAPGKSAEQIAAILRQLASNDRLALASRCDAAASNAPCPISHISKSGSAGVRISCA